MFYLPLVPDPERSLTRRAKGGWEGFYKAIFYAVQMNKIFLASEKWGRKKGIGFSSGLTRIDKTSIYDIDKIYS